MTEPTTDLPRGPRGGIELCHRCSTWRATEHVRDVDGVPVCHECDPPPTPDDTPEPPPKRAARKRSPRRAAVDK